MADPKGLRQPRSTEEEASQPSASPIYWGRNLENTTASAYWNMKATSMKSQKRETGRPSASTNGHGACGDLRLARYQGKKTYHTIRDPTIHRSGFEIRLDWASKETQIEATIDTLPMTSVPFLGPQTPWTTSARANEIASTAKNTVQGKPTGLSARERVTVSITGIGGFLGFGRRI